MIELIPRSVALQNECLRYFVHGAQNAHVTADEIKAWPPEDAQSLDFVGTNQSVDLSFKSRFAGSSVVGVVCATIDEYPRTMGAAIRHVMNAFSWRTLTYVLEARRPWRYQDNDYPPVRSVLDKLARLGVTETFDGALRSDDATIGELVEIDFWLGRCCAALPYIYFVPPDDAVVFALCKYGQLHAEFYDADLMQRFRAASADVLVPFDRCADTFTDDDGRIDGRRILVAEGDE